MICYSAAISACEKAGQWQHALGLFDQMPNAQVVPNFFTYAAAISACEKDGQWQLALSFFNAMRRAKMSLIKFDETP